MKSSELRIGNLVTNEFYDTFKDVIVVDSANEKGINLGIENSNGYPELQRHWIEPYYTFEQLRGIPLTEEWLFKFGFTPYSLQGWFQKEIGQHLSIHINSSMQVCLYAGEYIDGEGALIESLKYVHQLQNLYFTITGEELTIKETVDAPPTTP